MHEGAEAQLRQVVLTKLTAHGGENTGYLKLSCILRQNTYQNLELCSGLARLTTRTREEADSQPLVV